MDFAPKIYSQGCAKCVRTHGKSINCLDPIESREPLSPYKHYVYVTEINTNELDFQFCKTFIHWFESDRRWLPGQEM